MIKALAIFLAFVFSIESLAQKKENLYQTKIIKEKSKITGQENEWKITGRDAVVMRDSGSRYIQIHITESKEALYGNRCAELEAQKMGIEFIIIPKDIGYGMTKQNIFFTNLHAQFRAFWKNGFFWKKRLKKRIRRCQELTGDYIR